MGYGFDQSIEAKQASHHWQQNWSCLVFSCRRVRDLGSRDVDGVVRPEVKDNWRSAVDSRLQAYIVLCRTPHSKAPIPR